MGLQICLTGVVVFGVFFFLNSALESPTSNFGILSLAGGLLGGVAAFVVGLLMVIWGA